MDLKKFAVRMIVRFTFLTGIAFLVKPYVEHFSDIELISAGLAIGIGYLLLEHWAFGSWDPKG